MKKHGDLRSPLAKVRGLGSAHDGTGHFIVQRVTAIVLIPLTVWFIFSILGLAMHGDHAALLKWLSSGTHAVALVVLLIATFWHAKIGVQVVIEDYLHCPLFKMGALLANAFFMYGAAACSVLAVLKLHLHL